MLGIYEERNTFTLVETGVNNQYTRAGSRGFELQPIFRFSVDIMEHIKVSCSSGDFLVCLGDSEGLRLIPFSSYPIP